jgi:hypothetical protein
MFRRRPDFVRVASVTAVAASGLALGACGGAAGSPAVTGAAPSAASTVDPLAALTVDQLEAKAIADAQATSSVTVRATVLQSGATDTVDIAIKPGQGCTGTLGLASSGSVKVTEVGSSLYLNPDNEYWTANGGSAAQQVIALVGGRYIKVPTTDKNFQSLTSACDLSQMFSTNGKRDTITKGKVTTRDGTRVLALNDLSDGSVGYVTDTGEPLLLAFAAPPGSKAGAENATVTYGAPVTLTTPPVGQVIDGSKLGM